MQTQITCALALSCASTYVANMSWQGILVTIDKFPFGTDKKLIFQI